MHRLGTCLWFDGQAEEAARFYTSIFQDSGILAVTRWPEGGAGPAGSVLTVQFILNGKEFLALNGGPDYPFTPAISMVVSCDTQEEVDVLWARLSLGGEEGPCGWLTDRFGVSWQVVPEALAEMLSGPDPAGSQRAMAALMGMKKLDIAALRRAYQG